MDTARNKCVMFLDPKHRTGTLISKDDTHSAGVAPRTPHRPSRHDVLQRPPPRLIISRYHHLVLCYITLVEIFSKGLALR